jgi:hypothetical protein
MQHHFARYPYKPRAPQPGYRGPAWAAPGPYRGLPKPPPPATGCLTIILVTLGVGTGTIVLLCVVVVFALARVSSCSGGSSSGERASKVDSEEPDLEPDAGEVELKKGPLSPNKLNHDARYELTHGSCQRLNNVAPDEKRDAYQLVWRNAGAAKRLRGRVAVVHLRLRGEGMQWTMGQARTVDSAALLTQKFFEREAARYGVTDLKYDAFVWKLPTNFRPPVLKMNAAHRVDSASADQLVNSGVAASERSLTLPLSQVTARLRKNGYEQVAYLLHLPIVTEAREFAAPAPQSGPSDIAVIYLHSNEGNDSETAFTTTHETLHLFGADDLYPLKRDDEGDQADVMRDWCEGYGDARIQAMTAYAIGFTDVKPKRVYPLW